jgi:hypothetical protein
LPSFTDLPWISIQYPPDSLWRIITWQVDKGNDTFAYHGYWQDQKNGALTRIAGPRGRKTHDTNAEVPMANWRGALVYKIIRTNNDLDHYYLLTYKQINQYTKVKTLEPLIFDDRGMVLGRKDLFNYDQNFEESGVGKQLSSRLSITYSVDANASIRYENDSDKWVFDHLIVVQGRIPGQGPTPVPDGSYRAFEWKNKSWKYQSKLFTQINDGPVNPNRAERLSNEIYKSKKKKN